MPISRTRKKHKEKAKKRAVANSKLKEDLKAKFLKWAAEYGEGLEEKENNSEIVEEIVAEEIENN